MEKSGSDTTYSAFQKLVNNRFLFRFYLLKSLPMGFIAGVRMKRLTHESAVATLKYRWLTQNPFGSLYFACMAMAAEMTTALLIMNCIHRSTPSVSMLIIQNEARYFKKAKGKITFICNEGDYALEMVERAKQTSEGMTFDLKSEGIDEQGNKVAEFTFTWSLKAKVK